MRVIIKDGILAFAAETEAERLAVAPVAELEGHVFLMQAKSERGLALVDLGPRDSACREPLNIVWTDAGLADEFRPISNLAPTPFTMDGRPYASIEGFWQGLKFRSERDRSRIAALAGTEARNAGAAARPSDTIVYEGLTIPVGRPEHWALMRRACEAKFSQNAGARQALLATGDRPLVHKVRTDSRTIPGVILADIWMQIRTALRRQQPDGNAGN